MQRPPQQHLVRQVGGPGGSSKPLLLYERPQGDVGGANAGAQQLKRGSRPTLAHQPLPKRVEYPVQAQVTIGALQTGGTRLALVLLVGFQAVVVSCHESRVGVVLDGA